MRAPPSRTLACAALAALAWQCAVAGTLDNVKAAIQAQIATEKAAAASQARIDQLAEQAEQMRSDYRLAKIQHEALRDYTLQVGTLVAAQEAELQALASQIAGIEQTNRGVVPLMARMLAALDAFVALDLPFLPDERRGRLVELRTTLDRADVSLSEKYRRLLEAYQVEMEYGRTLEAYRGTLGTEDRAPIVDFLRIGRVGLYYRTLDGRESGAWHPGEGRWESMSPVQEAAIGEGLLIARKQQEADLLRIPLPAPQLAVTQ